MLNSYFRQALPYFFQYLAEQKWIVLRDEKNQPFHLVNDKILVKACFHLEISVVAPVSHMTKSSSCLQRFSWECPKYHLILSTFKLAKCWIL